MAPISQREARRLMKRCARLEHILKSQRRQFVATYPGGVNIATLDLTADRVTYGAIRTARLLGHAVVIASEDSSYQVRIHALPHPAEPIE